MSNLYTLALINRSYPEELVGVGGICLLSIVLLYVLDVTILLEFIVEGINVPSLNLLISKIFKVMSGELLPSPSKPSK